jgi:SulP family sulfate permease
VSVSPPAPTFAELFTPKLVTVLREGYGLAALRADAVAGLTVAIVALPLSMAIAIASGASPGQGLITAVVGGFVVSLLGGSRLQIGGPAGAFIVLVGGTVAEHGMDGLILATFLSGIILAAAGLMRLGSIVRFIPYPVTVGFTAGIAVIIAASQVSSLLGLAIANEPRPLLDKIPALAAALPTVNGAAVAVSLGAIAIVVLVRRHAPRWPGMLIAVALAAAATAALDLPVATIGSAFGGIPSGLPAPALPDLSPERVLAVLPNAFAFALLGAIESLLSAVVADAMSGRRHRSNCELVAQGLANMASASFGGFCVTGAIARTATNVRSGARSPVSGMLHAVYLLLFMVVGAPLAAAIPLAALAGILVVVAWTMVEKPAIRALLTGSRGDAAVLLATFGLTIFRDLIEAIIVGVALGSLIVIRRLSALAGAVPLAPDDVADGAGAPFGETGPGVVVVRITGAFFFGSAASIGSVLDRIGADWRVLVIDLSAVPLVDATAANLLEGLVRTAERRGAELVLAGGSPAVVAALAAHGVAPPHVRLAPSLAAALALYEAGADAPVADALASAPAGSPGPARGAGVELGAPPR